MKVEPIRNEKDIQAIKRLLEGNKRDLLLFVLGINCGIRTGDLVQLRVINMKDKKIGDTIPIKEGKTGKRNYITINKSIWKAWQEYCNHYQPKNTDYIFFSRKQGFHLHTNSVKRLVEGWCNTINLSGNYGAHTLRKTFGYHQRIRGTSLELLMYRFNHTNPSVTKDYIGITDDEIRDICMMEI